MEVPPTPWQESSTSRRSQKSERKAAKTEPGGARVQPGSGSVQHRKGDVIGVRFLIEDKYTDKACFSVSRSILAKTCREAMAQRRLPQWRITVDSAASPETYRVLREDDYLYLAKLAHAEHTRLHA